MNKIWANCLISGTKAWADVPEMRRNGVKTELASRVGHGTITADEYQEITGEVYAG